MRGAATWVKLHATGGKASNTDAEFACASGQNSEEPPVVCRDAGRTNIQIKKWKEKEKNLKSYAAILLCEACSTTQAWTPPNS